MAKRKRSSAANVETVSQSVMVQPDSFPPLKRKATGRRITVEPATLDPNPDTNKYVIDGLQASRASPEALSEPEASSVAKRRNRPSTKGRKSGKSERTSDSFDGLNAVIPASPSGKEASSDVKPDETLPNSLDPKVDCLDIADEVELKEALSRPPPVNSPYLPLPWKGRLGYACLCTYLRNANPPVFSSRTCRIASILENRHPLKDTLQPPHPTKNRPDKEKPADVTRGQAYVEGLGLANARDIIKMIRWNDRFGIKFMRLSSEMFPFASHEVYGYKLAPFASEALEEAGRVIAELGHRVTTHPGQFTQLGSPRKEVIENSLRDLDYHAEMLSLLKLPPQQDRDAVMILHMGGVFGDKAATLDRFRTNYKRLSQNVKNRLVLENDDVSWSCLDLLPICEELNIPFVLDYHHHNIIFDADKLREGTFDIMTLYDRITTTWTRKKITQKMHYSEPTPAAITGRQRRKHSPRVATLPPCDPTMDLMIEAKDKEQAVFELMRTFKLPGYDKFNDIIPHVRTDENKQMKTPYKMKDGSENGEAAPVILIPDGELGMGGPDRRVYWPPGMEEWLRPAKKIPKVKNEPGSSRKATGQKPVKVAAPEPALPGILGEEAVKTPKRGLSTLKKRTSSAKKGARGVPTPTPSTSDDEESVNLSEASAGLVKETKTLKPQRSRRTKAINYAEGGDSE